jgi:SAM-dependent methyltransferase
MISAECSNQNQQVVPKARGEIHDTIILWFSKQKPGKILDAPAGYGHLSMHLKSLGYDVTCGEINPSIFRLESLNCIYTDLNDKIESDNDSFDYICCVDGLEHMTNPYRAVQEFARVLKPGGYGIFSIPNYSSIESRSKFFWNGYLTRPTSLDDYLKAEGNLFDFHNSPLTITLLDFIFSINGLKVESILRDKVKWKQYFWFPFVMILKLNAHFQAEERKKKYRYDLTLKNEVIFGGNTLIFITRKTDREALG